MMKISCTRTILVEGRVEGAESAELERTIRESPADDVVVVDLRGVDYVDEAGGSLLKAAERRAVVLSGCSAFLRIQIDNHDETP